MSSEAQSIATRLHSSGLLRSQGLIGGKWIDAYDGRTMKVCMAEWILVFVMLLIPDAWVC